MNLQRVVFTTHLRPHTVCARVPYTDVGCGHTGEVLRVARTRRARKVAPFRFSEVTSRDSPATAFRLRKAGPAAAADTPAQTSLSPLRRGARGPGRAPPPPPQPKIGSRLPARASAPPLPAHDDPRGRPRRRPRRRTTHMCGFLLKALVMSFTTRCTSTATSSLVSAMLAAAAAAGARLRESAGRPAGVPRGARACAPVGPRPRPRRSRGRRGRRRALPGQAAGGRGVAPAAHWG